MKTFLRDTSLKFKAPLLRPTIIYPDCPNKKDLFASLNLFFFLYTVKPLYTDILYNDKIRYKMVLCTSNPE